MKAELGDWVIATVAYPGPSEGKTVAGPVIHIGESTSMPYQVRDTQFLFGHVWYFPDENIFKNVEVIRIPREEENG